MQNKNHQDLYRIISYMYNVCTNFVMAIEFLHSTNLFISSRDACLISQLTPQNKTTVGHNVNTHMQYTTAVKMVFFRTFIEKYLSEYWIVVT